MTKNLTLFMTRPCLCQNITKERSWKLVGIVSVFKVHFSIRLETSFQLVGN